jgi:flagellar assembly protein FliH
VSAPFVFEQLEAPGGVVAAHSTAADRAAEIVGEAEARAAEIEAEARRAGNEAGYAEGVARADAEARDSLAALAAAAETVSAARADAVSAVEGRAAELALLVAERILGAAVEVQPELVVSVVGSALRRVVETERLVIDVNPDDLERVRDWLSDGSEGRLAQVEVRAERRVGAGGCVLRTPDVEIDARIAAQLERARDVVRAALATR